jgi:hypothetical protein
MAASAFTFYHSFREFIGDNTIDLDGTNNFKLALFRTSGSAHVMNSTNSTWNSLSNAGGQCSAVGNYALGGLTLAGVIWTAGTGGSAQVRWDATDVSLSASATIQNIRYAVIHESAGGKIMCRAALTTTQTDLNSGSKLTVQFAASGIFKMT